MARTPSIPLADRPKCKGCATRLRPIFRHEWVTETIERTDEEVARARAAGESLYGMVAKSQTRKRHVNTGELAGWGGYDGFHSLRCALNFALRAHAAGYRNR